MVFLSLSLSLPLSLSLSLSLFLSLSFTMTVNDTLAPQEQDQEKERGKYFILVSAGESPEGGAPTQPQQHWLLRIRHRRGVRGRQRGRERRRRAHPMRESTIRARNGWGLGAVNNAGIRKRINKRQAPARNEGSIKMCVGIYGNITGLFRGKVVEKKVQQKSQSEKNNKG